MTAGEPDWSAAFRRMVARQGELFDAHRTIAERTRYSGEVGSGGDRTLELDQLCEDIVFEELERLVAGGGPSMSVVSEERGEVLLGSGEASLRLVVDPIDGSLNVRRTLPSHTLSIAVARGDSLADVEYGYVYDFGAGEEMAARRGEGALLNGEPLRAEGPGYGLEVVGLESAKPEWIAPMIDALAGRAYRLRIVGTIALTLSYVAAGRFDAAASARNCRSVDAAAAVLLVTEAGGAVEVAGLGLSEAGLGLDQRYAVAAAIDEELLAIVCEAQQASLAEIAQGA